MIEGLSTRFKLEKSEVDELSEKLRLLSEIDSLTGLYNRRFLEKEYYGWENDGRFFSLCLLDLDYFKEKNDKGGHDYGDEILKKFSAILKDKSNQNNGLAIRLGGEEFLLLIPYQLEEARRILVDVANELSYMEFQHGAVTFSAGIVQNIKNDKFHDLLKKADKLMYQAKKEGRNRICS